jgi:hypothetical protein
MTSIWKTYAWASAACLAIALTALSSAVAQQQSDQDQSTETQQQSSDEQSAQQEQSGQQDEQQCQQQQRQQQDRDQQSRDRDQAWSRTRESRASRDRDQWPQPNGDDYGSDSLRFRSDQQFSRDSQRSASSQQGGLGVSLMSDGRQGVIVSQVHPGSPAEEMGIRERDRITQVNGREVQSVQQFIARIRNMEPGQQIELDIRRAAGGERTVSGELESRSEALADRGQQSGRYDQPGQRWSYDEGDRYGQQGRGNRQTSYEEDRTGFSSSQRGSGQIGSNRLEQIERQVDQLSREIDNLRYALQDIRRQSGSPGQSTQWNRERTASYDEYERTTDPRRTSDRWDADDSSRRDGQVSRDAQRSAERGERSIQSDSSQRGQQSTERGDRFDEGPGGEIGEDRQRVGSDDIRD